MGLRVDYPCGCVRVADRMRFCEEHHRRAIVDEAQASRWARIVVWLLLVMVSCALVGVVSWIYRIVNL